MIQYDVVLEDLPERMQELTLRLRDVVLSLGGGIREAVKERSLEYAVERPFVRLDPDARGVTLFFAGAHKPPLDASHPNLTLTDRGAVLRLVTMTDLDDAVRRVCRAAFQRALPASKTRAAEPQVGLPAMVPAFTEALQNMSRALRLWMHQLEVAKRGADARARSAEKANQRRSHKKKAPAKAPALFIAEAPATPAPAAVKKKKKPAPVQKKKARAAPVKKQEKTPARKAVRPPQHKAKKKR